MACYAAVASLLKLLNDIVHHDRYNDLGIGGVENIESLLVKVMFVQGLLRQHQSNCNKEADDVLSKIRDVVYEVQDMIQYEILQQMTIDTHFVPRKISNNFVKELGRLEKLIDSLAKGMVAIIEEQMSNELEYLEGHSSNPSALDPSHATENMMIGFDEYLLMIKDELSNQSFQFLVISIVGMGGIGKTTLARNVFYDPLIMHRFDCRGWVTISQNFYLDRVLHSLMKSLGMEEVLVTSKVAQKEMDHVKVKEIIYKYLKGRRYLIVIDDIWSIDVWDGLKWIFPNDHNGSRILLTSRLKEVASYSTTLGFQHEIGFLNEKESWNLLREKVFASEECLPELEGIGKLIAKKCRGLPLAIVVIAGVLSKIKRQHHWKEIEKNISTSLFGNNNNFSNLLSLSYSHLPHHLKPCFLYIGRFPEDYEINISRLINLLIAEGFIELRNASKSLEEVAEECLHDLVQRSLIVVTKRKSSGKFKCCVMHDLLKDYCKQQGLHEQFFHVMTPKSVDNICSRSVRRVNVHGPAGYGKRDFTHSRPFINDSLRSIIWFGGYDTLKSSALLKFDYEILKFDLIYGRFKLLEILDLLDGRNIKIQDAVFLLRHLKYLAFNVDDEDVLFPSSISNLQNLQTLIVFPNDIFLHGYIGKIVFPSDIWELRQLRHLITKIMKVPTLPHIVVDGGLENLQTLTLLSNFVFTEDVVKMISSLTRLKVRCSETESKNEWNAYGLYNLVHLHKLEKLSIWFTIKHGVRSFPNDFTFPLSLKKLCLKGTHLLELGVVGLLPSLQVLKLRHLSTLQYEWEPVEGEFLRLKFLLMESLPLKQWKVECTHFPCLQQLSIRYCKDLVDIPLEIGNIPTLRSIHVYKSKGAEMSALLIQEEQESMGNDIQVRVTRR